MSQIIPDHEAISTGFLVGFIAFAHSHRDQPRNAQFLHSDSIENVSYCHRALIMSYDDELDVFGELLYHLGEASHVRVIKRGVHLIKNAEWTGLNFE